jgi:hypothetical protein
MSMTPGFTEYPSLVADFEVAARDYWMRCECGHGEFCTHCQQRASTLAALDAYVAGLEADRARLDKLEGIATALYRDDKDGRVWRIDGHRADDIGSGEDIRAAIDAAQDAP